jgi:tRNA(fMet)-specific endonuclease VapC
MYLLDTNICIYGVKNSYPALTQKLLTVRPNEIYVSAVTVGELEYGCSKSKWGERSRNIMEMFLAAYFVLPFTRKDAILFGHLRAELAMKGTPIGPYDIQIAAQGVSRGLTVVTHNVGEFNRVPGLKVDDWTI